MKYLRLYKVFLVNNIERELQYRFNFFAHMFTIVLGYLTNVLFYYFLYNNVSEIAGWGKYEVYILISTIWIIDSIFGGVLFFNLIQVPGKVRNYDLDYALLKPINTIFLLSFRHFNLGLFSGSLFGIGLLVYSIIKLSLSISIYSLLSYTLLVLLGVVILYSILLFMVTFSLKFVRINGLIQMFWSLMEFGKNPHSIYPDFLKKVMTFLLPALVIYNFPPILLLGKHQILNFSLIQIFIIALVVSSLFLYISIKYFYKTIKYYYN